MSRIPTLTVMTTSKIIVHTLMYRHTCTEIQSAQYQSLDGKCI